MALKFLNRAYMTSATVGTGTLTLGSAVSGYQSFASAGIANGDTVFYVIEDGTSWEVGLGTYTASGTTLARTTVLASSNANAAISCSGSEKVFCDAPASWLVGTTAANLQSNAADALMTVASLWSAAGLVTLTDAATIAVDMSGFLGAIQVTIGASRTLGNPSNTKVGQVFVLLIIEDGTGGWTMAYASNYKFPAGTPTIDTGAGKVNVFSGFVKSSTEIVMNYLGSF